MSKYKGDLMGFPDEVVEWMCDQQVKQGNPRNISVFENRFNSTKDEGGFNWDETDEGDVFCYKVLHRQDFDLILENVQKPTQASTFDEHRFQAACAAMSALLSSHSMSFDLPSELATLAVAHADALIEALRKGKQDDTTTTP